jgi:CTP:molybdopterin cytidylyltransferase MocA
MDCVILAAGKGSRLDGITAPFHKPLLVMNGKPLISRAVDAAALAGCNRVVVVVAPENALAISQVLGDRWVRMLVQRKADGPGSALRLGLDLVTSDEVLILMADNMFASEDIDHVCRESGNVVGTEWVPADIAARLTWLSGDRWVEKEPVTNGASHAQAWVGPIKLVTREITNAIDGWLRPIDTEMPLGPLFNSLATPVQCMPVQTIDIGVPEALA